MSWEVLARHEAGTSVSGNSIRLLLALLIMVCVFGGYLFPVIGAEPHTTAHFGGYMTNWMVTLVPLIGLLIGYNAIVSERTSGSLLLTLSLPHSRADVVIGKLLGRSGVISGAIVIGLLAAGSLVVYPFGELDVMPFLGFVLLTIGLACVFTGLGIAISMTASSKQRATVAAFAVYFLFILVWSELQAGVVLLLQSAGVADQDIVSAVNALFSVEPGTAYERLVAGFIDPSQSLDGAWYLQEWFALVVFVGWLLVPIGLAYVRFAEVDL